MTRMTLLLLAAVGGVLNLHREARAQRAAMKWVDFDGPGTIATMVVPRNRAGDTYPSQYQGEGGRAIVGLDAKDAVAGRSVRFEVTRGTLYAHFNSYYADGTRGFVREYVARPERWQFNTYNRLSFWLKCPANAAPLMQSGQENLQVGTYVKRIKNADRHSDEAGGDHGYHHFNVAPTGTWTRLVMNVQPSHFRGQSGGKEHGNQLHPTKEPEYNYFDALTRLYIDACRSKPTSYPAVYHLDEFEFYREPNEENDEQVYSIAATYVRGASEVILTWSRRKDEPRTEHEVRYAFEDIHKIGWDRATPAPGGIVRPLGDGGYNGMLYRSRDLPLDGKRMVYLAIKPTGARLFSQIALPLW